MKRWHLFAFGIIFALVGYTCGRGSSPGSTLDLVKLLPLAEVQREEPGFDMGDPGVGPHLVDGWSSIGGAYKNGFLWGLGESSVMSFWLSEARLLTLTTRAWPFRFDGAPPQRVEVLVNGEPVGEMDLSSGPPDRRLPLTKSVLRVGLNTLTFQYAYSRSPAEVGMSNDPRPLAVAWGWIGFEGIAGTTLPMLREHADQPTLVLPYRTQLDYFLKLSGETTLELSGIVPLKVPAEARGDVTLEVLVIHEKAENQAIVKQLPMTRTGEETYLQVSGSQGGRVQISLRPRGDSTMGDFALQLIRPRLRMASAAAKTAGQGTSDEDPISSGRPNIIIYLVDTLRADHLGTYGYSLPTSPAIDSFAEEATVFEQAMAPSSWTRPSVASILTGLYPKVHGVNGREDALPKSIPTLATLLGEAGYETAAFVTNGNVTAPFGFSNGFETFDYVPEGAQNPEVHQLSDVVNEHVFEWMERRSSDRPCFLYVHTVDPHGPYKPRSPYKERFVKEEFDPSLGSIDSLKELQRISPPKQIPEKELRVLVSLYDAEIAFNDESFGHFVDRLKRENLYESSLIVFVSDHGEEFLDHGRWEHGVTLFQEQLRVPLIVRLPEGRGSGGRIGERVRLIDIFPTALEVAGVEVPSEAQGSSLLPLVVPEGSHDVDSARVSYAYLDLDNREIDAVIDEDAKLIRYLEYDRPRSALEVYDLSTDPAETRNLIGGTPVTSGYLRSLLRVPELLWKPPTASETAVPGEPLQEHLRALGYLD